MIKGITQKQISEITGIAQPNICNYLNGRKIPTVDTATRLAEAMGINAEDLYRIVYRARLDRNKGVERRYETL
jgi:transcriptional regulator with XRE-family HTH domain